MVNADNLSEVMSVQAIVLLSLPVNQQLRYLQVHKNTWPKDFTSILKIHLKITFYLLNSFIIPVLLRPLLLLMIRLSLWVVAMDPLEAY